MIEAIKRVIIEEVTPAVNGGRFAIRRAVGDQVRVGAHIFADGHDVLAAELMFRKEGQSLWRTRPMTLLSNDEWQAVFRVSDIGAYEYTVQGWIDRFRTWLGAITQKYDAGQNVNLEMIQGARLVAATALRAEEQDRERLTKRALFLESDERILDKMALAADPDLIRLMESYPDKNALNTFNKILRVTVEPLRSRFSAWYELFPRSCRDDPARHGTFDDCIRRLPQIAAMGFDVLYLPPIHPIGRSHRKGRNNTPTPAADDPGSPWAIGGPEGGHKAVHPDLGDLESFQRLVEAARGHEIDVALDLAFQCSPDHPYVTEHPEWFASRPDGSIQYAENPPKKYEDIYPFDFESEAWAALCSELLSVVRFWIDKGVRIFRVDNPHTKPLRFWEWLISQIKTDHPEVCFLAEAFTRPKIMYRLAKAGFTQSYTYFTWRNLKSELEAYLSELTRTNVAEFFWPNFWPNTPDILPEYLQLGGRPAHIIRLTLAATLSSNYGIYGPVFELCENKARTPFSEEYDDSEKYALRHWDLDRPGNLRGLIRRINQVRHENKALQQTRNLVFHTVDQEDIICYSKYSDDRDNIILTAVNLDPHHKHAATLTIDFEALGLDVEQPFQVHDLISDVRYLWQGETNYIELDPQVMPVHIFRIRKRLRSEHDFDYFI